MMAFVLRSLRYCLSLRWGGIGCWIHTRYPAFIFYNTNIPVAPCVILLLHLLNKFFILPLMKKNKTGIIIVVVVLLILIGGGVFFLMSHSNKTSESAQSANPQAQSPQKKSLFDFFSMAGSQKCTFSDGNNTSSGVVYIGNGKMRGDFQSASSTKTGATHMVNDGTYIYMWTDGQQSGYKMSLAVMKQQEAQITESPSNGTSSSQPVDMQQKADYSCGPWSVDASLFTVPTNVTFTDYSSMMQQGAAQATHSSAANGIKVNPAVCAQCNKAPAGSARSQCLEALHCQ